MAQHLSLCKLSKLCYHQTQECLGLDFHFSSTNQELEVLEQTNSVREGKMRKLGAEHAHLRGDLKGDCAGELLERVTAALCIMEKGQLPSVGFLFVSCLISNLK